MANERARGLGYKFVTDDKYLVDPFSPTDGISYEGDGSPVSYANSGIMAQAPIIYPPINQGGGDDGGGFTGPTGPGSYDSAFDPNNENEVEAFNKDIGVGTVAEEDDEEGTSLGLMDLIRAGGALTFGGPLNAGYSLKRSVDRNKQKEIDKINAQYGPSDPGSRGRDDTPGFGKTAEGNYSNQFEGGDPGLMADGGRAGYFFGGRVNYKVGGRINFRGGGQDASSDDFGGGDAPGQQVSGGQTTRDNNNDGGNSPFYGPKPTFFNNPEILNKETILGDIPTGIGFDNSYGRYKATMDLEESLKEKGLEGEIEYNNNIGNFDLAAKYNTQDGPSYGAGYTGNNFDVGVNNKTGASANYSKDIFDGRGKITAGGTYNPDGTYNAEGKISFNYANGGLAGLL